MENEKILTIVTPTYNRAHTLPACYGSLCKQTDGRFIWMIIDDGSKDDTESIVSDWITEAKIKIIYLKKENGGKASALNLGIDTLTTPFAACLDSDDTFYPNAVEKALLELSDIIDDEQYCGILALRNSPDGKVMGGINIPKEMTKVTGADVMLRLNLSTEYICFYKTDILMKYRFPVFEGEKFVSPAWMMYTITQSHYYKTSWEKYCCCEYISDGLTKNKKKVIKNNPHGYTAVKLFSFNMSPTLKLKIKNGIMYDYGCILGKDRDCIKNAKYKLLALLLYPVGLFVAWIRRNV